MSVNARISVAALATLLAGCAHYGWTQSPKFGPRAERVSVATVAAPADEGLDTARLTRALVGQLGRDGLDARWSQRTDEAILRCSVTHTEVGGFDDALFARAEVTCEYSAADAPARRFAASGRYAGSTRADQPTALLDAHASLQEAAALDALDDAAAQISAWRVHRRP